jgi:hypothetical protein
MSLPVPDLGMFLGLRVLETELERSTPRLSDLNGQKTTTPSLPFTLHQQFFCLSWNTKLIEVTGGSTSSVHLIVILKVLIVEFSFS